MTRARIDCASVLESPTARSDHSIRSQGEFVGQRVFTRPARERVLSQRVPSGTFIASRPPTLMSDSCTCACIIHTRARVCSLNTFRPIPSSRQLCRVGAFCAGRNDFSATQFPTNARSGFVICLSFPRASGESLVAEEWGRGEGARTREKCKCKTLSPITSRELWWC